MSVLSPLGLGEPTRQLSGRAGAANRSGQKRIPKTEFPKKITKIDIDSVQLRLARGKRPNER
jgi:hypothetical protein